MYHEIVSIADVYISVGVGNLGLADQQPVHPFTFEFFAIGKDQHSTATEFSHFQVAHLADHRLPSLPLRELEHSAVLEIVLHFGRRGTIARVLQRRNRLILLGLLHFFWGKLNFTAGSLG